MTIRAIQFDYADPAFPASVVELAEPALPNATWAHVQVTGGGICGSDLHLFDRSMGGAPALASAVGVAFPFVLGHEIAGVVTGHHAPSGPILVRSDLAEEAIRLARLLVDLMPDEPECVGLLALFESTYARRATRLDADGAVILLADADREQWDREAIDSAASALTNALQRGRPGPFQIQAAISLLHSSARDTANTDWPQIVQLYDALVVQIPSRWVRTNRAIAVAQVGGPTAGLDALDAITDADDWHLYHSARGELLRQLDRASEAAEAFRAALACEPGEADARLLRDRLAALEG